MKILRTFFRYLKNDTGLNIGEFYKNLYVMKEDIPVICLMPEQLKFLITNEAFHNSLSCTLQKSKLIFVFGCTVALRRSDLFSIKFTDLENRMEAIYLNVKTRKTGRAVKIRLPKYATEIIEIFRQKAGKRTTIFPNIPPSRFNNHIKMIAARAGWKSILIKDRRKRGVSETIDLPGSNNAYRFCDHLGSHTMRRTAITSMLMLGINEYTVKLISGHCINSKSFSRYVSLAQSYIDQQVKGFEDYINA